VREQANCIKCAANLRSIGHALTFYTQQHRYYPGCQGAIEGSGFGVAAWPVRLRPFVGGQRRVFDCPSQDERCAWTDPAPVNDLRATDYYRGYGYEVGERLILSYSHFFSYGYNYGGANGSDGSLADGTYKGLGDVTGGDAVLMRLRGELRASRVRVPAETVAITDSTADALADFVVRPIADAPRGLPGRVHNAGANALFCDGHVQWYPQKDLVIRDVDDPSEWHKVRMWNNDHGLNPWQQ